jgi:hypothetical protein
MELLDSLVIREGAEARTIELWHGNLAALPPEEAVDILVVSAFPDDYSPLPGTLIGSLHDRGVSVEALAADRLVDQRSTHSCWLSHEIEMPGSGFRQVLCFEPFLRGRPEDVVGDIFRCLVPWVSGPDARTTVAMPVVSSGDVGVPLPVMFEALLNAAADWMAHGLPLQRLKIFTLDRERALELKGAFAILKRCYARRIPSPRPAPEYDVFVSYCHADVDLAAAVVDQLRDQGPEVRIFIDRAELEPGVAWQQKLYQSIDSARKVLTLYSPAYLASKACQEEYNIAQVLHQRSQAGVLFPVFARSADLPPYMTHWQYIDCREADQAKLRDACSKLVTELRGQVTDPEKVGLTQDRTGAGRGIRP